MSIASGKLRCGLRISPAGITAISKPVNAYISISTEVENAL